MLFIYTYIYIYTNTCTPSASDFVRPTRAVCSFKFDLNACMCIGVCVYKYIS